MFSNKAEIKSNNDKREYHSPKLITYGALPELTQNGSGKTKENNGKGLCGPTFDYSGSSSC